ncbi:MAG TPA: nucleoside diphosphate kinase regulator [Rhizomicrobium sp.]|nr:nucleoside diphosphate kinase regulator [Rhizomicrobium sp.]
MSQQIERPRIVISEADHERLQNVVEGAMRSVPGVAEFLQQELDRASVDGAPSDKPSIKMGSFVEFRDDATGRVRTMQLVYPAEADAAKSRISVLTPIGAALIGLSENQSIEWQTRTGENKMLTVLKVQSEPETTGYLDM